MASSAIEVLVPPATDRGAAFVGLVLAFVSYPALLPSFVGVLTEESWDYFRSGEPTVKPHLRGYAAKLTSSAVDTRTLARCDGRTLS